MEFLKLLRKWSIKRAEIGWKEGKNDGEYKMYDTSRPLNQFYILKMVRWF